MLRKTVFKRIAFSSAVVAPIFILALMVGAVHSKASAQEAEGAKAKTQVNAYRLDFSINELEGGKKVNTRQYAMNVNSDNSNELKIGTRVPVESKQGEFQYLDVGTSLWSRVDDHNGAIDLSVRAEISNFAAPEEGEARHSRPILRQFKISASTVALLGKPMAIGSVDDPNSTRQFQLEVTVTKLK
jgi:hypothetical protein